ncbi:MAG: SRPBCC domain-containing protein [Alphaproteobacteria bacterium]|jgi:uncharacterized protein YndB with AHSA1/START domain|nr:MAG: SRPBCC domain-containing protein [Alphaproteobacteria bacterium]
MTAPPLDATRNLASRDDELRIERTFDAPLALVWRLWEDRDHMIRWWGPESFTCLDLDWQLDPGKPWRARMASKQYNRKVSHMSGVITEVETRKRIVFTFGWDEETGREVESVITVEFREANGQTIQSFHQTPFVSAALRDSHVGGWNSLINKQQLYVENTAIAESRWAPHDTSRGKAR